MRFKICNWITALSGPWVGGGIMYSTCFLSSVKISPIRTMQLNSGFLYHCHQAMSGWRYSCLGGHRIEFWRFGQRERKCFKLFGWIQVGSSTFGDRCLSFAYSVVVLKMLVIFHRRLDIHQVYYLGKLIKYLANNLQNPHASRTVLYFAKVHNWAPSYSLADWTLYPGNPAPHT
jgi:hypothetical protein